MREVLQGVILDVFPAFVAIINRTERGLILKFVDGKGPIHKLVPGSTAGYYGPEGMGLVLKLLIDTGFSGGISCSSDIIRELNLEFVGEGDCELANGQRMTVRNFLGLVEIGGHLYETRFIEMEEGSPLLGMELLMDVASTLVFEFNKKRVLLLR